MSRNQSNLLLAIVFCGGCSSTGETVAPIGSASSASSASVRPGLSSVHKSGLARTTQRLRGADEVRVALVVLPGDALVEVDDLPVRRRHGLVEFVGKVGDEHRVRVFSGAMATEERIVKIESDGPSPARIDATTMKFVKVDVFKKKPVKFNINE